MSILLKHKLDLGLGLGLGGGSFSPLLLRPSLYLDANKGTYQDAAIQFNASALSHLTIASSASTQVTGSFTWAGWVYFDSDNALMRIAGKGHVQGNGTEYSLFRSSDEKIYLHVGNGSSGQSVMSAVVAKDAWRFVVGWYDATAQTVNVQIDDASPVSESWTGGVQQAANPCEVGGQAGAARWMDGRIDSLMFFKTVLDSDARATLYNSGEGLLCSDLTTAQKTAWGAVSGWDFGESGEMQTRYDSWGTNHLTPVYTLPATSIEAVAGIARGQSQDSNFGTALNGTDQYYSYSGSAFDPGVGDFAIALAVYPESLVEDGFGASVLYGSGRIGSYEYIAAYVRDNGGATVVISDGVTPKSITLAAGTFAVGQWSTIIVNHDRDENMTCYIDGVQTGTPINISAVGSIEPGELLLGRYAYSSSGFFEGKIDNAFFINRLLTADEITWLHNTGQWRQYAECGVAGNDGSTLTDFTAFWEFDDADDLGADSTSAGVDLTPQGTPTQGEGINYLEGIVSRWEDQSGNGYHALQTTIAKRPAFVSNAINNRPAVRFDGVDDFMAYTLGSIPGAHTVFVVFQCMASGSNSSVWRQSTDAVHQGITIDSVTDLYSYHGAGKYVRETEVVADTYYIVSRVWDGGADAADMNLWLDGDASTSKTGTPVSTNMTAAGGIGGEAASNFLEGEIAEVWLFPTALNAGERGQVETYLASKYRITLS